MTVGHAYDDIHACVYSTVAGRLELECVEAEVKEIDGLRTVVSGVKLLTRMEGGYKVYVQRSATSPSLLLALLECYTFTD